MGSPTTIFIFFPNRLNESYAIPNGKIEKPGVAAFASAILAAPFLKGCSRCVCKQIPSIKISTIPFWLNILLASRKASWFRCRNSFPSLNRYTGIIFSNPSNFRWMGFLNASPRARKWIFCLKWAAMMMASRNELGWLETIKQAPFISASAVPDTRISEQKILSANLTSIFNGA